ncbi:16S rRNA (uracil(1498)-N(3))-methyltransferase [Buchnera aphidicola]|uniref:16S rRNA (uracil(1498)-N(3))-methyltransferase n=1 Tax=Buchnera aphidicola TaxID=9 RepID=UPI003463F857
MNKKIPRIYIMNSLKINTYLVLPENEYHYIKNVLRMQENDLLEIFNNTNYVFLATIKNIKKKNITVFILKSVFKSVESNIDIHLGQIISKDEKMNFTIQKSIELGVKSITPLFLNKIHAVNNYIYTEKKIIRWKKIAISACQQCHRNIIPKIKEPIDLQSWCANFQKKETKIVFHPESLFNINQLQKSIQEIYILVGSEQGFSKNEIKKINNYGFISISLGPRILRTETASIAALSILQFQFGDVN